MSVALIYMSQTVRDTAEQVVGFVRGSIALARETSEANPGITVFVLDLVERIATR